MRYHILFYFFVFVLIFAEFTSSSPNENLNSNPIGSSNEEMLDEEEMRLPSVKNREMGNGAVNISDEKDPNGIILANNYNLKEINPFISQEMFTGELIFDRTLNKIQSNPNKTEYADLVDHSTPSAPDGSSPISGNIITIIIAGVVAIIAIRKNLNYFK
ncbi:MAG: hypothetical protein GF401_07505 [Chitinivibrionales bacterium]|nr:hypothetical protein [Chitinivibrionales bacterium]